MLCRWLLGLVLALTAATSASQDRSATLPLTPCKLPGNSENELCGRLTVPENWDRPNGRTIALKIMVFPKIGPGPEDPPMLWLEGGPGIAGMVSAPLYATVLRFDRERHAVILFDQRGTGESGALHCPATEAHSPLDDIWPPAEVAACRRALEAHADLAQYNTKSSARDVDAIRAALGYPKLDLAALSYGTLLAQAYMKLYPEHVHAAALIGTVPLGEKLPLHHAANAELAVRQIIADCRSDSACSQAYPNLAADWAALQRRLAAGPITVRSADRTFVVRQGPFNEMLRSRLLAVPGEREFPRLVHAMASGDDQPLLAILRNTGPSLFADGLYLSITCPEGTRRIAPQEIGPAVQGSAFGRWRIDQQIAACRLWAPARAAPELLSPLNSQLPVLLISGGRDSTAPTAWARQVAARLPNSRVVVIEPLSHAPIGVSHLDCIDRMMNAFFAAGSAARLDTGCVATMRPPPFAR